MRGLVLALAFLAAACELDPRVPQGSDPVPLSASERAVVERHLSEPVTFMRAGRPLLIDVAFVYVCGWAGETPFFGVLSEPFFDLMILGDTESGRADALAECKAVGLPLPNPPAQASVTRRGVKGTQ